MVRTLQQALDSTRLDPARLKIEITESVLMHDLDRAVRNLHDLRKMGVRLSIDDLGTGYSSLASLERFPVQELKIDRSFISGIVGSRRNAANATAVIGMAHDLSLSVVTEGVESEAQRELLQRPRCPDGQGYHFSPPESAEEIGRLLGGDWRSARPARSVTALTERDETPLAPRTAPCVLTPRSARAACGAAARRRPRAAGRRR